MGAYNIVVDASAKFTGADWPYYTFYVDGVARSVPTPVNTTSVNPVAFSLDLADGVAHSIQIVSKAPSGPAQLLTIRDIRVQGQTIGISSPFETYVSDRQQLCWAGGRFADDLN